VDVVAADEAIAVLVRELAIDILLGLLHGDVHVAVEAGEDALVADARVEFHEDRPAEDSLEEIRRLVLGLNTCDNVRELKGESAPVFFSAASASADMSKTD